MTSIRIAVDVMGGDFGPDITLPACRAFLDAHPQAELLLVGLPEQLALAQGWLRTRIVAHAQTDNRNNAQQVRH